MPTKEIKSLRNCFRILSLFNTSHPKLDADQISQLINIPKSSVYRYLNTLIKESILEYDSTMKRYSLGLKIYQLGATAYRDLDLRKIAVPFMEELAEKTKETVYLSAFNRETAICIERIESNFPIRLSVNRGDSFPLHASATARVLMAYLPEEEQDEIIEKGLKKFTEHTITDPVKLKKNLKAIRRHGFAYSDQELDFGARAVSAPIFNFLGRVVAGLSIAGPMHRFTHDQIVEYKNLVIEYSKKISSKLGNNRK
jgi:IclR family KDG regulon transcriptional repressor